MMGECSLLSLDGGVPLALKNGSSASLGMMELVDLIKAFEKQNGTEVRFEAQLVDGQKGIDLRWRAMAYDTDPDNPEARLLASVSVRCGEKRLVTMEAVLLQLLYALDFQLAQSEFAKVEPKS